MDCSPPGSCVHEIFQVRMLEWVAISFLSTALMPPHNFWYIVFIFIQLKKILSKTSPHPLFLELIGTQMGNSEDA